MKNIFKKYIHLGFCITYIVFFQPAYAATVILDVPKSASSNSEPFNVVVSLDAEGGTLAAIEGHLSFDTTLFRVETITTRSSVVPLWLSQPKLSNVITVGTTSTILFEGIMPGGYKGVRSPYYDGVRPGFLFIVSLIPINNSKPVESAITLSQSKAYLYNEKGTALMVASSTQTIQVPVQSIAYSRVQPELSYKDSNTLQVIARRDPYISNNKWYVSIIEDQSIRPISKIQIAETSEYDITYVDTDDWKEITTNLYVLQNQSRTSYTHLKIFYENNTYTTWTIPPVENLPGKSTSSRILIGISFVALLFIIYVLLHSKLFLHIEKYIAKKFLR